ncbi:MAG: chemotaxis protein CheR [Cyclobacteriaceae bacterium]|nr:chemotaxis protein CheR [Cyclobacteriaceae bacterium]
MQTSTMSSELKTYNWIPLTSAEFSYFSRLIQSQFGIKMPEVKITMLQSRLQRRLRALQLPSFTKYIEYLESDTGKTELVNFIDVVSTNKTDFFREPVHFEYLTGNILPELSENQSSLKIWSAGCSTGEEPYTLSIVLEEFISNNHPLDYSIFATDISSTVLQKAQDAIYDCNRVINLPLDIKKKYFLKSKNPDLKKVRVQSKLRGKVSFDRLNFMDGTYEVPFGFNVIFCRNVLIYFDRPTQEAVINKLCDHLRPDGYFFLGHSESIARMDVPLKPLKPTIYRRI